MRGVDEDEAGGLVAIPRCEDAHDQAAERVTDEDERWIDAAAIEERVELVGDASGGARHRARIAPSETRAIVGADSRQRREGRLDERPADRRSAERRFQDDRRSP